MTEEIITSEDSITGEDDVASAEGGGADSVSLKDLLSAELGKEFPTDAAALKATKDTFSYVGKVGKILPIMQKLQTKYGSESEVLKVMEELTKDAQAETPKVETPVTPQVDESKFISREQYETDTFFAHRPDLVESRPIIEAMRARTGKSLAEVVEMPEVKGLFEKAKAYEEVEKSKSVLQSNPRLGKVADKLTQSKEAAAAGDVETARSTAVEAVMDVYGM